MPRNARLAPGGMLFHVLNRGVGRMRLFLKEADFEAFERIMAQTLETRPMRILAYCLLSNHWHMLLWPERDGDLAAFMQKLTITHAIGRSIAVASATDTSIKAGTNRFRSRTTNIFIRWCATSSATPCVRTWCAARRIGGFRVSGGGFTAMPTCSAIGRCLGRAPGFNM
jgi:REP element-mobilizing transposase RayT